MGIPLVLGGAAIMQFRTGDHRRGWLLASATATYVIGVLGVTIGRNVPLNDALDAFDLRGSTSRQGVDGWLQFPVVVSADSGLNCQQFLLQN
jgi:uncharacterized membrane protein